MNGMLTLVSVTTFLAGFVAADFSGFVGADWDDSHWILKFLYVCMLAYAEGSCLYIAICGTMACATHLRAANQIASGKWQNMCLAAVEPIRAKLGELKGRRMETIKAPPTEPAKRRFRNGAWNGVSGGAEVSLGSLEMMPDCWVVLVSWSLTRLS